MRSRIGLLAWLGRFVRHRPCPIPSANGGKGMKVLILLLYFERPNLVRNALLSVRQADEHHPDWELVVIDDGSRAPVLSIVAEMLGAWHDRISVIETRMSAA